MKTTSPNRREFLATGAAAAAALSMGAICKAEPTKAKIKKALIGNPNEKTLSAWKEAGFEGMEATAWNTSPADAEKGRKIAEKLGMKIHSVMRGWANFNSDKQDAVDAAIAGMETALRAAEAYGADAVLLVPCRVGGIKTPQPWEFDIEFDPKTGLVDKVVKGDNAPYADYIKAQNHATESSRAALKKLIPTAEKTGVVIAVENVWNNLWVKPKLFANFVASFDSPWVQTYFDIGNHVKYAKPEEWIRALGKTIVKLHVKDFKLNADGRGGKFCNIREGSVNWPAVMKELDATGYDGWMTIEGSGGLKTQELNDRLDLIIAGR